MFKDDQMFEAEILITFPTTKRSHQVVSNCVTVLVFSNKTTLLFMTSPFQKHWLAPTLSLGHQGLDYLSRLHESFRAASSVFQKTDGDLTTLAFAESVCCKEQIIWRVIWSHDWRRGVCLLFYYADYCMRYTDEKHPCLIKRPYFRIKKDLGGKNRSTESNHTSWDRGQPDIKLGRKHVINKLTSLKVNRLEGVYECVFYRPEHNAEEGHHRIEILRSWNAAMKYTNG